MDGEEWGTLYVSNNYIMKCKLISNLTCSVYLTVLSYLLGTYLRWVNVYPCHTVFTRVPPYISSTFKYSSEFVVLTFALWSKHTMINKHKLRKLGRAFNCPKHELLNCKKSWKGPERMFPNCAKLMPGVWMRCRQKKYSCWLALTHLTDNTFKQNILEM